MDPFAILPYDITEKILSYLTLKEILKCCTVSKSWYELASCDEIWKVLCANNGWSDCGSLNSAVYVSKLLKSEKHFKKNVESMNEWKKHYILKSRLYKNWRIGRNKKCNISCSRSNGSALISVSNNGGLVAFGFESGLLKLFDVEDNGKQIYSKECLLKAPITCIKIVGEVVAVLQDRLLQIYTPKNGQKKFELSRLITFLGVHHDFHDSLPDDLKSLQCFLCDYSEDITFDLSEDLLITTSKQSDFIHVVDLKSDKFEYTQFDIDIQKKVIQAVLYNNGIVYLILCIDERTTEWIDEAKLCFWSIHAYSVKNGNSVFEVEDVGDYHELRFTMECNDHYLLVRLPYGIFFIFDKFNGELLYQDCASVFLDANSTDKMLVGVVDEYENFQIFNPKSEETVFCMTLEGCPIAMCSNILITMCVEYDAVGKGTVNLEFWDLYNNVGVLYRHTFVMNDSTRIVYTDQTRLIIQYDENSLQVFNYLR